MNASPGNDTVTAMVRRHDPDRFLTALFAPSDKRDALMVLYAFNHELARAREVASQPMLALIRLQWWREVVEGDAKRHEIASPLSAAIKAGWLDPSDLAAIIEARELEAEDLFDTMAAWQAWLWQGAGGLTVAAARLLGASEPEAFRRYGAGYGGAGVLRSLPLLARAGRCPLPLELLAAEGLGREAAIAAADTVWRPRGTGPTEPKPNADFAPAALRRVLSLLAAEVARWLGDTPSRVTPRTAVAAALPGVLARRDLARLASGSRPRGLADRAAVLAAAVTGRV